MSASPVHVSDHAIKRYVERWHPDFNLIHARNELRRMIKFCEWVHDESRSRQSIWRTFEEGVLLVVSEDGIVKTVLPRGATRPASRRSS